MFSSISFCSFKTDNGFGTVSFPSNSLLERELLGPSRTIQREDVSSLGSPPTRFVRLKGRHTQMVKLLSLSSMEEAHSLVSRILFFES